MACPQFVPASGVTVDAAAFVAAHRSATMLRVCAVASFRCREWLSERLRPEFPAVAFLKTAPGSRIVKLRVIVSGPAGVVLLDTTAGVRLRRAVDAACPDVSSYHAVAVVSRDGKAGTG